MAGTCRGLVEGDKNGIWFIVVADNMQGRGGYQVTCTVMIWETGKG